MTMEMAVDIMRNLLQTGLILAIPILELPLLLDCWLALFGQLPVFKSRL